MLGYQALTEAPEYFYFILDSEPENYLVLDGTSFDTGKTSPENCGNIVVNSAFVLWYFASGFGADNSRYTRLTEYRCGRFFGCNIQLFVFSGVIAYSLTRTSQNKNIEVVSNGKIIYSFDLSKTENQSFTIVSADGKLCISPY